MATVVAQLGLAVGLLVLPGALLAITDRGWPASTRSDGAVRPLHRRRSDVRCR